MKIKHLLLGMLAMASIVACKQDEPLATPELNVDKEAVTLTATAGEATFNVTSNQDWTATADADWVSLEPASGAASKDAVAVKVTAEDNEATEARTATVTVKAGELTKTVALTQSGTEATPEPELPTPNVDWTSDKVVSYDLPESASSKRQLLKNIKYTFDENYLYVKLQASAAEFAAAPAEYLGIFVYDVTDGSGDGYYGWWNDAKGNVELEGEHIGTFNGKDITLTIGETPVEVVTEENGDELVWTMNILRSAHENLALENPYFAFLTYIGWEPNGALPDKYENMLQFTPAPKPVEPVTEGVIWENDGTAGASSWSAAVYRYSIEGGDSQNECVAEIPAAIWAGMKIAPFTVNVSPAPEATWWQIRITDGWWETGDQSGDSDITMNTAGLVNYGDGTYAFQVDLTANPDLAEAMDTKHLLFAGDSFIINKIYFGEPEAPAQPEPEPEPEYTLDGKQWMAEVDGMQVLFDFGLAEEGMLSVGMPSMDGTGFGLHMAGLYEIVPADATSGVINFTQYDWEWDEFADPVEIPYSELTATTVKAVSEGVFGTTEPISFTLVENPYEITPPQTGGDAPSGAIENGEYWFFNGEKVMAPLAEDVTTGVFAAKDMVNYASTAKNAFTFTYDPDMAAYTIQDSYGRYLGHPDWETTDASVVTVLPTGEDYAYYLWVVDDSYGDGTADVYNLATYFGIGYFATENSWYLSEDTYSNASLRPSLVPAENPVEEPVEPEGPKVVTAAEFNAATDNSIEYQVSGTISGIYQAYSSQYNNISIYISDETGEILAYRVSCAGITDPANTLTKGDLITVKGKRTLYNEKPQMAQGGVIVSHTDVVVETPAGAATLSFADKANRTVFTDSQQVWEQNGVKLINDKASSSNNVADYAAPARFYQSSKLTVEYAGMTKIEFTCNNGSYATELKNSIKTGTVTVSGSVVTVVLDSAADSFVVASLAKQVRMDSLTVYAE